MQKAGYAIIMRRASKKLDCGVCVGGWRYRSTERCAGRLLERDRRLIARRSTYVVVLPKLT